MIYVTHDQVEAMTLADKIVVLRAGRIEQVGAPLELYRNPDNRFVAGFIGSPSMNFLKGTVKDGMVDVPALGEKFGLDVTLPANGTEVLLGLRPEHVEVSLGNGSLDVELTEALGGVSYTHLKAPSGDAIIVEERGDERASEGDKVAIRFDPKRAMLFDATTEARIR